MEHTQRDTESSGTSANRCTSPQRDAPPSGAGTEGNPSVEYTDLFSLSALKESSEDAPRAEGDDTAGDRPPSPPDVETDLFGNPVGSSEGDREPDAPDRDPFASNRGEPPAAPSLPFTAPRAQRVLYADAFRAAYRYPESLMLVMQGVRKGLKRGKDAAQR